MWFDRSSPFHSEKHTFIEKDFRIEILEIFSVLKSFKWNCFLLEELEGLASSSTVREQKT